MPLNRVERRDGGFDVGDVGGPTDLVGDGGVHGRDGRAADDADRQEREGHDEGDGGVDDEQGPDPAATDDPVRAGGRSGGEHDEEDRRRVGRLSAGQKRREDDENRCGDQEPDAPPLRSTPEVSGAEGPDRDEDRAEDDDDEDPHEPPDLAGIVGAERRAHPQLGQVVGELVDEVGCREEEGDHPAQHDRSGAEQVSRPGHDDPEDDPDEQPDDEPLGIRRQPRDDTRRQPEPREGAQLGADDEQADEGPGGQVEDVGEQDVPEAEDR